MTRYYDVSSYEPPPVGNHPARLVSHVFLGTQESELYGTKKQCWLRFELPTIKTDSGEPSLIGKFCSGYMSKKAKLREIAEAIRAMPLTDAEAKKVNVGALVGGACMISVTHSEGENGVKAKVSSVTAVPEGLSVPKAKSAFLDYDCEDDGADIPDTIPQFVSDMIARSPEWKAVEARGEHPNDDVPM